QPEWQRFVTLVKQSQELKHVSYHKLYDILKQHQHEVNEIRAKKIARAANPLALVAQKKHSHHPHTHPNHFNQNSSTRTHQSATRKREKAVVNSPQPIYDQEPSMIYKSTNNNLRTSSNTSRANQDNSPRIHRNAGYEGQRSGTVAGARDTVGSSMPKRAKDAAYHREKMLLCKQEEAGIQLNAEQADWRDDTDDESDDQELEAHYMYMAKLQQVSPDVDDSGPIFDKEPEQKVQNDDHYDVFAHVARECQKPKRAKDAAYHKEKMLLYAADNSGPIFDSEPLQKVPNNDNYNVFAIKSEHPEQSKSINDTYSIEQDEHNVIIDSLDISYDREQVDQDDDDDDLTNERDLLAYLIKKLKCVTDDSKNRNKFLETSNKVLVDKLQGEIEDFKTKNRSLESSNNHFKKANNELSKINQLMYKDLKKFQAELDKYHDVKYASKVEIDCEKAKGDLMSYKMESEKSFNEYT
nr:hypothetical protein [Tanacetum cinerariifolium]